MGCLQSTHKVRSQPPDINRLQTYKQELELQLPRAPLDINRITPTIPRPARVLPEPPEREVIKLVVALYSYEAITDDEVSFRKGDVLEVFQHQGESDWWLSRVKNTSFVGYIPSNYVSEEEEDEESQDWWCPVVRSQAERMLLSTGLPHGTFLIRHSTDSAMKALSVRVHAQPSGKAEVKHFKIKPTDDGGWWITSKQMFISLPELVSFYKVSPGLCCRLTLPCPKLKPVIPFREMEVDRNKIQLSKELGHGFFGRVYLGKMNAVQDVAVKTLKVDKTDKEAFLREAKAMHELRHNKLVQLMGVCTIGNPLYIITELMSGGDLLSYLKKDRGKTLDISHLIDMSSQVAYGMSYLESHNYIHRDLRAGNILVGANNEVKVADFGLARLVGEETNNIYQMSKEAKFPVKWTSPEAGLLGVFTIKSDVWSFGILLYEMVTYGRVPYPGMSGHQVLEKTETGYRMEKPFNHNCPDGVYKLMLQCWDKSPNDRPTFDYLSSYLEDFQVSSERNYAETNQ